MQTQAAGRPGRPNDKPINKQINKTKEDDPGNKTKDQITRQSTTRMNNAKHNEQEHSHNNKTKDEQQNHHPAWNPDSRSSR